jgi:hypothetical protein
MFFMAQPSKNSQFLVVFWNLKHKKGQELNDDLILYYENLRKGANDLWMDLQFYIGNCSFKFITLPLNFFENWNLCKEVMNLQNIMTHNLTISRFPLGVSLPVISYSS